MTIAVVQNPSVLLHSVSDPTRVADALVAGIWTHADLTGLTGAPPASGPGLSGYEWQAGNSKQVVYFDGAGHVHELYVTSGGNWAHADLTGLTGAPPASGPGLRGYEWRAGNSKQVIYFDGAGHVHELYVTSGGNEYAKRGATNHFVVYYAKKLGNNGPTLADAVLSTCETDYNRLEKWFGQINVNGLPFNVYIKPGSEGGSHGSCSDTSLYCDAFDGTDANLERFLVVTEADEVFMANQGVGWDCGASNGEALSRVLATESYPNALGNFASGTTWLNSNRPNFVNQNDSSDRNYVSIGCGTLFINWLHYQLGYPFDQIVQAGGATLAVTYRNLGGRGDPYGRFSILLDLHFPAGEISNLLNDNPFPLTGADALAGALSGYQWGAGSSKQVVYLNGAGHVHELYVTSGGNWTHADLTGLTGAPPASGPGLSGYEWQAGNSKQVVYLDGAGDIHELYVTVGGSWAYADLI